MRLIHSPEKGVTQFGESVTQFIKAIESAITEMNEPLANLIFNYSRLLKYSGAFQGVTQLIEKRS
jgi:hypothetical protein